MKKVLRITAIVLLVLIAGLITAPFIFKGKIIRLIKQQAIASLNARLDFSGAGLSLIRSFPDFSLRLDNLSISGIDKFEGDTLIDVPQLRVTIGLMSIINGESLEIKSVKLDKPVIKLLVLADGSANWDIAKPSADSSATADTVTSTFRAALKSLTIQEGSFVYDDATLPMRFEANEASLEVSGDLTADYTDLLTDITIGSLTVDYDGIRYLSRSTAQLKSKIGADLAAFKFTFPDAALRLNALDLLASGYFAMPDNGYDMDVKFGAIKNDFRAFLSMVPAVYAKDFEQVQTKGSLSLKGFVKGLYSDNSMPAFGLDIAIADAMFRYPDLPQPVENIAMKASVSNATGDPDATIIDIPQFHFEMAKNPVEIRLYASTPVSDPYIDTRIKGKINLSDVGKFYPLSANDEMSGILDADLEAKGKLSAIDRRQFDQFFARGSFMAANVVYKSNTLPQKLTVTEAQLKLSPASAELPVLKATIGRNDFSATGKIENLLAYFFDKGDLKGSLELNSNYLNINDFMSGTTDGTSTDTAAVGIIEVPGGIDFVMSAGLKQLVYDNLDMKNVDGTLRIKDKKVVLEYIRMQALDGAIGVSGIYSTANPGKPEVDFMLDIKDVDVKQAFTTFNTMEKLAPVAGLASGKISTQLNLKTDLDGNMMPVYSSVEGGGNLKSPSLTFSNVNTFSRLADALKIDKFKQWVIEKVNLSFEMVGGKVFVKPFETALGKSKASISGWNSFDETMEYTMNLAIPRSEFGGAANNVLTGLVSKANKKGASFSLGETVPVAVLVSGTVTNPKVSVSLNNLKGNVVQEMKQQITESIQQKKEEAVARVREEAGKYIEEANARAQQVLADAQKQADNLMKTANESAASIRSEADKRAQQLIAEGKKNGPIAEMAAKKTAEKAKKEADTKANQLVGEAQKQSDAIMAKARQESDKIVQDARDKAAEGK